jgi:hypothetical protein
MEKVDLTDRQCTATSKHSKKRCCRSAIRGGTVCVVHGGKAPQVQRSAAERLRAMVDPSLTVFEQRLRDRKQPAMQIQVARDVLDRTGYSAKTQLELTGAEGGPVKFDLSGFNDDELAVFTGLIQRAVVSR